MTLPKEDLFFYYYYSVNLIHFKSMKYLLNQLLKCLKKQAKALNTCTKHNTMRKFVLIL